MLSSPPRASSDLDFFSPPKIQKPGASPHPEGRRLHAFDTSSTSVTAQQYNLGAISPALPLSSVLSCVISPFDAPSKSTKPSKEAQVFALRLSCSRAFRSTTAVKRLRTTSNKEKGPKRKTGTSKNSSRANSRQCSLPPSPEPIYRKSRSRSTSRFPAGDSDGPVILRRWRTDEDGTPGDSVLSSEMVVKKLMKSYKAYFKNPNDPNDKSFEPHPTNYPVVELEFPNKGASERFILLAPKDKDHYNPIMDLERSLYTMVECCLPKELRHLFGSIPSLPSSDIISPPQSPSPSPPCSRASSSSTSSLSSAPASPGASPQPPLPSIASLFSDSSIDHLPVLRAVQRAINLQDGPLFLLAMKRVNVLLQSLKYPEVPEDPFGPTPRNPFMNQIESWTISPGTVLDKEKLDEKDRVLMRIIEETYQRTVGPNVPSLKQYEAFSSTVYGELMPSLAERIIQQTGLNEDSLFLDLGSGVGNVVVQASLQTGCTSYGIELMQHPARVANDMVEQMKIRARMWGVRVGEMELEQGDMLKSRRTDELIAKADVVLVDNKVFEESLNEALRPKFLDLKEGAKLVSLSPFVSSINARFTKRNVDDISAIFDVEEHPYYSGDVSWGNGGGNYYIHKVDREGYAKIKERFDSIHGGSGRSSRSRRRQS
ncbi:hypothetical protein NLJ89_g2077 [Agrocybe chaxingu]|uniref:Histone-lysine N-methyltransferase, H3 lysine-79 specific n=1 Tax=Agrocybe chaxingu TaxID=84603 RepID=A0A9W8MYV0_9AGAR|nr:hypothetical protein NLJ89_g2077 [Agrocybe chaxingu]